MESRIGAPLRGTKTIVPSRPSVRRYAAQRPKQGDRSNVMLSSGSGTLVGCAPATDRQSPSPTNKSALRYAIIVVVVMLVPAQRQKFNCKGFK